MASTIIAVALVAVAAAPGCGGAVTLPPPAPPPPWTSVAIGPDGGAIVEAGTSPAAQEALREGPVVDRASFGDLYAMSDVHGHLDQMAALLERAGLVAAGARPFVWTGGKATLVMVGDHIDKGPRSVAVIEALMQIEASADAQGGAVLVLAGNHEAEFFANPLSDKFTKDDGIDRELRAMTPSLDPVQFATGLDPRAAWMRARPLAARVGDLFFCHAGDSHGATVDGLRAELLDAFRTGGGFRDDRVIGSGSPLESREWYTPGVVAKNAAALGVTRIVFGHDPSAFERGKIVAPGDYQGHLIKIDAGLGAGDSDGEILHVFHADRGEVGEAIGPKGAPRRLFGP